MGEMLTAFATGLHPGGRSIAASRRSSISKYSQDDKDASRCPWCSCNDPVYTSHHHNNSSSSSSSSHAGWRREHESTETILANRGGDWWPSSISETSLKLNDLDLGASRDLESGEEAKKATPQTPPSPPFNPRENPDGGTQAWLTVFGAFLTLFCSFGWINTIGVWQAYYETHQLAQYTSSEIAWIPSLEAFMMFFLGPWAGDLLDRLCKEYYQFIIAQGIVSPVGVCLLFYAAMGTIPTWFFKKRGFAFSIVTSGSSLGGVILPIMTQKLIDDVGFGWSLRITALFMLYLLTIANFTITSRMPPRPKPFVATAFLDPLKEVPFALVTFGAFLFTLGFFIPFNFVIVEAMHYGMSASLASYLVSILNGVSLFGRIIPGYLADYIGQFNVMITTCFITGILILAMWLPATTNAPIILFSAFFGFFSGAFVSMCNAVIAEITTDMSQLGIRTGTFYAIFAVGALFSSPIGGALIASWNGSYVGVQIFAGIMCLAGACFIAAARVKVAGMGLRTKA
ncbi:monocarboxylate permease [Lecanosticta acicola]|uniref:Monocarboxylate permease n=1 Tax=Lecanosticta acicola TaxID=111012 RepID=A0AAI9EAC1_9PEZI|nr:monocarboxylate permease [Lecanosticta acicola]